MALTNVFTAEKAGMSGVDKDKVKKIIENNTSLNYQNHSTKQARRIEERIKRNEVILSGLSENDIRESEKQVCFR